MDAMYNYCFAIVAMQYTCFTIFVALHNMRSKQYSQHHMFGKPNGATNAAPALSLSEPVSQPGYVALLCFFHVFKSLRHLMGINITPAQTHMPQGHAPQLLLHAALPDPR